MNEPTVHVQAAIVTGDIVEFFADGEFQSITISAERAEMISSELTALREENAALRERLANNHVAMSVYRRDIAALRERVAALEDAFNKADHYIGCTIEDEELFAWQEYDAAKRKLYQPTADEGGE